MLQSLKIVFVLANSAGPDEMLHFAIFHPDFHGLPKYPFGVFKENFSGYRSYCTASHICWSYPRCFFGNFNCPKLKGRHNHDNEIVDNFDLLKVSKGAR